MAVTDGSTSTYFPSCRLKRGRSKSPTGSDASAMSDHSQSSKAAAQAAVAANAVSTKALWERGVSSSEPNLTSLEAIKGAAESIALRESDLAKAAAQIANNTETPNTTSQKDTEIAAADIDSLTNGLQGLGANTDEDMRNQEEIARAAGEGSPELTEDQKAEEKNAVKQKAEAAALRRAKAQKEKDEKARALADPASVKPTTSKNRSGK